MMKFFRRITAATAIWRLFGSIKNHRSNTERESHRTRAKVMSVVALGAGLGMYAARRLRSRETMVSQSLTEISNRVGKTTKETMERLRQTGGSSESDERPPSGEDDNDLHAENRGEAIDLRENAPTRVSGTRDQGSYGGPEANN